MIVYYFVSGLFLMFFWCPCMAMNVNVQYKGGLLPDIVLLILRTSSARGGGGGCAARLFLFLFFPVQQTTSGIGHRVKYFFSGWQPMR